MDEKKTEQYELMDPDFGRGVLVGKGFGSISEEEYLKLVEELEG